MRFKLSKRIEKIFNTSIDTLAVMSIIGIVAFVMLYFGFKKLGLFSYNGLPPEHIQAVYAEFQKRYPVLSKVGGNNPLMGGYFERGIAGSQNSPLYYFHYSHNGNGGADLQVYPLVTESWTTSPGIFNVGKFFTGSVIK